MYNASLKYKWDNKNVRDYEKNKAREEERAKWREQIFITVYPLAN